MRMSFIMSLHPAGSCQHESFGGQLLPVFIRRSAWPWYGLDVAAQGSRDRHPPILPAEWKSNGRLHLQTAKYHTTTYSNLKAKDTLYTHHILSQESSIPPPPMIPAPLQEWRHCWWTNRFQLRSHLGYLIWGKSRCARAKKKKRKNTRKRRLVCSWASLLVDAMSYSLRAEKGCANLRQKSAHGARCTVQLGKLN